MQDLDGRVAVVTGGAGVTIDALARPMKPEAGGSGIRCR